MRLFHPLSLVMIFYGYSSINGNVVSDRSLLWPKRRIPYEFGDNLDDVQKSRLLELFYKFHAKTCVRFVPRKEETEDYVVIQSGAWKTLLPHLGRRGGMQAMTFATRDFDRGRTRVILRDLLRTLGFYYEIQRPDRGAFVRVDYKNILTKYWTLFSVPNLSEVDLLGEGYDYGSASQYHPLEYSSAGKTSYNATIPDPELGQDDGLSETDVRRINRAYGCGPLVSAVNRLCPEKWISGMDGKCYYFSFLDPRISSMEETESRKVCQRMLSRPLLVPEMTLPTRAFVLEVMRYARIDEMWAAGSIFPRGTPFQRGPRCETFDIIGNLNVFDAGQSCSTKKDFTCQQTAANECVYVRNDSFAVYPACLNFQRVKSLPPVLQDDSPVHTAPEGSFISKTPQLRVNVGWL